MQKITILVQVEKLLEKPWEGLGSRLTSGANEIKPINF